MLTKSDVIQIINNDFHYLNTEFGVCKIGLFGRKIDVQTEVGITGIRNKKKPKI